MHAVLTIRFRYFTQYTPNINNEEESFNGNIYIIWQKLEVVARRP